MTFISTINTFLNILCTLCNRRSSGDDGSGSRELQDMQKKGQQSKEEHVISIADEKDAKLNIKKWKRKEELIIGTYMEVKGDLKFSYFATGIASAGLFGIYSGYLGNTSDEIDGPARACCFLVVAAFVSGAILMLLTYQHTYFQVEIYILKALKYTSFGYLTLSLIFIGYVFLNAYVLLAILLSFVPTLLTVIFGCIIVAAMGKRSSGGVDEELRPQFSEALADSVDGSLSFTVDSTIDIEASVNSISN